MVTKERLLALDVMRGITIAAMLLVNNPGSWSYIYAPLRHAPWHGLTPTDLIYPFFMFIMGVSVCFSLGKYFGGLTGEAFGRIFKRSILMFAVGLGLQLVSYVGYGLSSYLLGRTDPGLSVWEVIFPLETFRIMGVMQGLAIAYFFAAIVILSLRWKHLLWAAGVMLGAYLLILHIWDGYSQSENNVISVVDRAIMGPGHMYHDRLPDGSRIAFEPEGILSNISRIAHVILGAYAGSVIMRGRDNNEKINALFIFGTILLLAGLLLQYGDPINKKIWTSSYTLVTCGFASLFLALLIWIIDIRGHASWSRFFQVYGINPLFLYAAGWIFSVLFGMNIHFGERITSIKGFLFGDVFQPLLGNELGSLAYALLFVGFTWIFGYILYKKKIYIKL